MERVVTEDMMHKLVAGIESHGEEYSEASRFFKQLEKEVVKRIQERKEQAFTKEVREYDHAEDVITNHLGYDVRYNYSLRDGHFHCVFGMETEGTSWEDEEVVDKGVVLNEGIFEEPENNDFLQELAERRKQIEKLDSEIQLKTSQLRTKIIGREQLKQELAELKRQRAEIPDIRWSEERLEKLLLEQPDKRKEVLESIRTLQTLGEEQRKKSREAHCIGISSSRPLYVEQELPDAVRTVVENEGINFDTVKGQLRQMIDTINPTDEERRRIRWNGSDLTKILTVFMNSDFAREVREVDHLQDDARKPADSNKLTNIDLKSMSLEELEALSRQTDDAIAETEGVIGKLTEKERIEAKRQETEKEVLKKLKKLDELRKTRDTLLAQQSKDTRENEQLRPDSELR